MRLNPDISLAPRNVKLFLRHKEYGLGIGSIRVMDYGSGMGTHESASYAGFIQNRFRTDDPLQVTMPSPTRVDDLVGWTAHPDEDGSEAQDLATDLAHMDRCFAVMEKAMTSARDRLASAAEYADPATVNSTIASVADDLHAALKEVL